MYEASGSERTTSLFVPDNTQDDIIPDLQRIDIQQPLRSRDERKVDGMSKGPELCRHEWKKGKRENIQSLQSVLKNDKKDGQRLQLHYPRINNK